MGEVPNLKGGRGSYNHRPVEGRIKQVIIKRYGSGEWFALICAEETETQKKEIESVIGMDLGIKRFRF